VKFFSVLASSSNETEFSEQLMTIFVQKKMKISCLFDFKRRKIDSKNDLLFY
jgi:hypothetical protein